MLSKLRTSGRHGARRLSDDPLLRGDVRLEPVSGGTLGVCFFAYGEHGRRFLKTHGSMPWARDCLAKEISILDHLYGSSLAIERIEKEDGRLLMLMDELKPAVETSVEQILDLTELYTRSLVDFPDTHLVPVVDNFASLLSEGQQALALLSERRLLSSGLQKQLADHLDALLRLAPHLTPCICHGDLGPKNILTDGKTLFAIDWEDAFWGFLGYDYLYWLTFFDNRRHHSPAMLGRTIWGKEAEISIIMLIVLLKCGLALRNNSHQGNVLTFEQRLGEIAALA